MTTRLKPFLHRRHSGAGLGLCLLSAVALADTDNPLTGFYYGTAAINQPASLGNVDLAFYLDVTGSVIQPATSYIDLDQTLLFPAVDPKLDGKAVGPRVSGTLSVGGFSLDSQAFPGSAGGRAVTRRIRLDNARVGSGGAALSGDYTETVEGMTPVPVVISGQFQLMKPVAANLASGQDGNGDGCLSLAEIRAGGSDPDAIEFADVSAAMHLYRNPTASLKLGDPPGPDCANGEATLQDAMKALYGSAR
jgi:hypothetical protein